MPVNTLPPPGAATVGLMPTLAWSLNQKSAPAASLTLPTGVAGSIANSCGTFFLGASRMLWKPAVLNDTASPWWIVTFFG